MNKNRTIIAVIAVLSVLLVLVAYPKEHLIFQKELSIERGLDLQGGSQLTFEANFTEETENKQQALNNAVTVIKRRIDPAGTKETAVQIAGSNRIIVELPGVEDPKEAADLIGQTAQLQFLEVTPEGEIRFTNIAAKDLAEANVDVNLQTGEPIINFQLKRQAHESFAQLTQRIFESGGRLLIMLDDEPVFNGGVQSPIPNGQGQMTGFESTEETKEKAALLEGGALPVPLDLVSQRVIGPQLGQESVTSSVLGAAIGFALVAIFMIANYRWLSIIALFSLGFYGAATLTIYKISALTPYTIVLTLAGIAGVILAVAVAADASVLIFERIRDEKNEHDSAARIFSRGFDLAWPSIRDANAATFLTSVILYYFGAPVIKGFAVALGVGVVLNIVVSYFVIRYVLYFAGSWIEQQPKARRKLI